VKAFFPWWVYALLAALSAVASALWIESNGWRLIVNLLGKVWAMSAGIGLHKDNLRRKLEIAQRCADALKKEGIEL